MFKKYDNILMMMNVGDVEREKDFQYYLGVASGIVLTVVTVVGIGWVFLIK